MLEREYKEVVTLLQNLHNASSKASPTIGKLIDIYIETHVKLNALYKSNSRPFKYTISQVMDDISRFDIFLSVSKPENWVKAAIENMPTLQEIQEDLMSDSE